MSNTEPAVREAIAADLGESWHFENIPVPIMASEDFSYYLKEIPGAFALIGADDGQGETQATCGKLFEQSAAK